MPSELAGAHKWIDERLHLDPRLIELVGGRLYAGAVPQGKAAPEFPIITWNYQAGDDVNGSASARLSFAGCGKSKS